MSDLVYGPRGRPSAWREIELQRQTQPPVDQPPDTTAPDLEARLRATAERDRARAAELRALGEIKVPEVTGLEVGAVAWRVTKAGVYLGGVLAGKLIEGLAESGLGDAVRARGKGLGDWLTSKIEGG